MNISKIIGERSLSKTIINLPYGRFELRMDIREPHLSDPLVGIYRCKTILSGLIAEKKGDTPEAEYLRTMLATRVANLKKDYGDIIVNPDELLKIKPVSHGFWSGDIISSHHHAVVPDQKVEVALGGTHKDAVAFNIFEKGGISYDEKMNELQEYCW